MNWLMYSSWVFGFETENDGVADDDDVDFDYYGEKKNDERDEYDAMEEPAKNEDEKEMLSDDVKSEMYDDDEEEDDDYERNCDAVAQDAVDEGDVVDSDVAVVSSSDLAADCSEDDEEDHEDGFDCIPRDVDYNGLS